MFSDRKKPTWYFRTALDGPAAFFQTLCWSESTFLQVEKFSPFFLSSQMHFFFKFIYFERERERESARVGEGQRERERENPKQALHCQHRARHGAQTHEPGDHDLSRNQESDS